MKYVYCTLLAVVGIVLGSYLMSGPDEEIKYDYSELLSDPVSELAPKEVKPDYNNILLYTRENISYACDKAFFYGQDGEINGKEKHRIVSVVAERFGLTDLDRRAIENFMIHATEMGCNDQAVLLKSDTIDSYTVQRGNRTATFDADTGARK